MKKILITGFVLLLVAGTAACRGTVTETGNVCPGGDCSKQPEARNPGGEDDDDPVAGPPPAQEGECNDATAELVSYEMEPYEVTIGYPDCWDAEEKAEGDPSQGVAAAVWLTKAAGGGQAASTVKISVALMGKASIESIAAGRSPGCVLQAYAAAGLTGYACDLSTAGKIHRQYTITKKGAGVSLFLDAAVAQADGVNRMLQHIAMP